MSVELEILRRDHRRALAKLGLLDRPWVLLGGAPSPILPDPLRHSHARVDINNAGLTAKRMGWGEADLTVRRPVESWDVFPDLKTKGLLWFTDRSMFRIRWKLIRQRQARVGKVLKLRPVEREAINAAVAGAELTTIGELGKPSSGIAALCYALFCDVPEVVLSGFSFRREGHSFDSLNRPRMQMEEDRFVLSRLSEDARVATAESELAEDLGLRLWRSH